MPAPGTHLRAAPPEWPGLVAQADEILQTAPGLSRDQELPFPQATAIYRLTDQLDNLALERSYYYGLGLSMCEMAKLLSDPEVRETTVESMAKTMSDNYPQYGHPRTPRMRIKDIGGGLISFPFADVCKLAAGQLSAAEEVLTVATGDRTFSRRGDLGVMPEGYRIANTASRDRLPSTLMKNAQVGASSVLRRALLAYGQGTATPESFVGDVIDMELLRGIRLERVAVALASLRVDEFQQWVAVEEPASNIVKQEGGELVVDKKYLRQNEPGPVVPDKYGKVETLRPERLTCPALQAGLIPIILDILPEVTMRADALIQTTYGHRA